MKQSEIQDFYNAAIKGWPLAAKNIEALRWVKKKSFDHELFPVEVQFNPARAVSTLARLDKKSISDRKCFLCRANRPWQQQSIEILEGWHFLVNPYPILPYHFTIVSQLHVPQTLNLDTGFNLAEKLEGMVVFYNDDGAGASAPDHMHYQAVPIGSLPLIRILNERAHTASIDFLPFKVIREENRLKSEDCPVNAFFWCDNEGRQRFVAIPRRTHRPAQYFLDPPYRRAVSPGAIDMAGILVTPIEEDFDRFTLSDIQNIYRQVGYSREEE